jgi:hypothetical protein
MKTLQYLAITSIIFLCTNTLGAEQRKEMTWEEQIKGLLESEAQEGFYDQPGFAHLWGKVEVNGVRGVLICPEGGLGKAFLILKSGDVYEREATAHGVRLSYCPTINMMDPKVWNKFEMDKHWTTRKREGLARDFASATEKAWASANAIEQAEQAGTGQPATRPESKSEGSDKPQPEAEGRSR